LIGFVFLERLVVSILEGKRGEPFLNFQPWDVPMIAGRLEREVKFIGNPSILTLEG
jgi:hypothetical protein